MPSILTFTLPVLGAVLFITDAIGRHSPAAALFFLVAAIMAGFLEFLEARG